MKLAAGKPEEDPNYPRWYVPVVDITKMMTAATVALVYAPTALDAQRRAEYLIALLADHPVVSSLVFKEEVRTAK